jgi:AhpD family alkylhydroperoxidase
VLGQDSTQVPFAEDQHPIGHVRADREHEPLREGVRARASRRDLRCGDACIGQECIERGSELPSSVADQKPTETLYHPTTPEIAAQRTQLAPGIHEAFDNFSRAVFADGALPAKTKQLIAVAVAQVTQCPYCITGHTKLARRIVASPEQIMEAIWVAAEMRAGGAYAHSTLALHAMNAVSPRAGG